MDFLSRCADKQQCIDRPTAQSKWQFLYSEFGDMFFRGAAPILEGLGGPVLVLLGAAPNREGVGEPCPWSRHERNPGDRPTAESKWYLS